MNKILALKLFAYALAGVGMLVANELQKREINEAVDEALAERDQNNVVELTR